MLTPEEPIKLTPKEIEENKEEMKLQQKIQRWNQKAAFQKNCKLLANLVLDSISPFSPITIASLLQNNEKIKLQVKSYGFKESFISNYYHIQNEKKFDIITC